MTEPSPPPPEADECDPEEAVPLAGTFLLDPEHKKDVTIGVTQTERLCRRMWRWFEVPTAGSRVRRYTERQVGADGVTRTVERSETIDGTMSVVLELDTVWNRKANRYPSVDVILANGDINLPRDWNNPKALQDPPVLGTPPEEVVYEAGIVEWYGMRDALTVTWGYQPGGPLSAKHGCVREGEVCREVCDLTECNNVCAIEDISLAQTLWVGVRCAWDQDTLPCYFDLQAHHLPRHIGDGDALSGTIAAAETHYFALQVGPFDALSLELTRVGVNMTIVVCDDETDECGKQTAGHGIIGWMLAARDRCPERSEAVLGVPFSWPSDGNPSPPPSPLHATQLVNSIDEEAAPFSLDFFCTEEEEAGSYAFAVAAAAQLGPFNMPYSASRAGANCKNGYVGPEGRPLLTSYASLGAEPACNPSGVNNELKPNVGRYLLTLRHRQYDEGALAAHEERPGCLSYGQWRYYTVQTTDTSNANAYVELSTPVSALLVRANAPPTLSDYNGVIGSSGTALAVSPCDLEQPPVWHIAIYLAPLAEQQAAAATDDAATVVSSTELTITLRLQGAQLAAGDSVAPRADGGNGFVCCGLMKFFLVPVSSALKSLRVQLNVTAGAVRAVFLKHADCVALPGDVDGEQCVGLCHMSWYASYDRYTGALEYTDTAVTLVPKGDDTYPDKRAAGSWYIGVQATETAVVEFSMDVDIIDDVIVDAGPDCDKFGRYACANEVWEVPPDLVEVEDVRYEISGAGSLGRGGAGAVALSGACAWALVGGWAWLALAARRRRGGTSGTGSTGAGGRNRRRTRW